MNIVQGGPQFGRTDRSGAKLSDDHASGSVREHCSVGQSRPRGNRQGEYAEYGVARTGNIEDLPTGGRSGHSGLAGHCSLVSGVLLL